ncbi:MAG TPA: alpha/beta hydrolase [Burkholderiaceae bacterium]|nr:alpha/beta hydrolase [Burkholderiaceae bacterium]
MFSRRGPIPARRIPPNLAWLALEPVRAVAELGLGTLLHRPLARICPHGDGHPVLILPGLGAHDVHTLPMRRFVARLGYEALPWQQGFNLGAREGLDELLRKLEALIDAATSKRHKKVSLIGWSLGGIFARELAKRAPAQVRQVITLGSPFGGHPGATHATLVYEWLSGREAGDRETIERVRVAPPVPFTSIFSKTDGIVAWPSSVQPTSEMSENIAVSVASHLGLITNPVVLYIVANRLAQPEGHWRPHQPIRPLRLLHPARARRETHP